MNASRIWPAKAALLLSPIVFISSFGILAARDPEPPRALILSINGKEYILEEGRQRTLDGPMKHLTVNVRAAGYRTFEQEGISFRYPADLEFAEEHDADAKSWSITGIDASLTVLVSPDDPEDYLRQSIAMTVMVTNDPLQKPEVRKGKFRYKGEELTTLRYSVQWDEDTTLENVAVILPPKAGKSRVLLFDLDYNDEGHLADECARLKDMVFNSLKF